MLDDECLMMLLELEEPELSELGELKLDADERDDISVWLDGLLKLETLLLLLELDSSVSH